MCWFMRYVNIELSKKSCDHFRYAVYFRPFVIRPDIVHLHFKSLGTEIFLRELTLSSTLSSNPESRPLRGHAVFSQTAILSSQVL